MWWLCFDISHAMLVLYDIALHDCTKPGQSFVALDLDQSTGNATITMKGAHPPLPAPQYAMS